MVEPDKKPGGADEVDIVACRAGSGLRLKRGAGTGLSITSDHDDRAVSCRWPDRYAWADPGRGHARVARTNHRPPALVPAARRTCVGFISKKRPTPAFSSCPIAEGRLRCRI